MKSEDQQRDERMLQNERHPSAPEPTAADKSRADSTRSIVRDERPAPTGPAVRRGRGE